MRLQAKAADVIGESLARLPSELLPFGARYIPIEKLELQMLLDQDVRTNKGVLLIAKGTEVTEPLLLRLRGYHDRRIVEGEIRVLTANWTTSLAGVS
jgi:hypothetical protein